MSETIKNHKAVSRAIIQINQIISLDPVNDGALGGSQTWRGIGIKVSWRLGNTPQRNIDCFSVILIATSKHSV